MSSLPENEVISKTLLTIHKYKSLAHLQKAVIDNEYTPAKTNFLRSLLWKCTYITESLNIHLWQSKLNDSRRVYHELIKRKDMVIPWYKLDHDNEYYHTVELSRNSSLRRNKSVKSSNIRKSKLTRVQVTIDDPLDIRTDIQKAQLGLSNLKMKEDQDSEILENIILDIDRLFPGEDYFNNKFYKKQLIEVLYVWAKCNPTVGYKQGFHEILGLIYRNIQKESVAIPNTNTVSTDDMQILNLFDIHYLCHDLFALFNKFMVNTGIVSSYYEDETVLLKSIESFNKYLMKVDQLIHYNLVSKLKLESQLWCIRYFRLILLRELGNDLAIINLLWDKLITVDSNKVPSFLNFLIIVMLINVKPDLIICDFSESLSLLLHYPPKYNKNPSSFVHNLFNDALKLLNLKDNDLKLYEYGMKINEKLNPDLKISLSYNGRSSGESMRSRTSSPIRGSTDSQNHRTLPQTQPPQGMGNQPPHPHLDGKDVRAEKMAFEKYRLEMRLKKKAQSLVRP